MKRFLPLTSLLAVLLAAGFLGGCRRRPALPRNLLLVTLDTTRADSLGSYGNRDAATPNLDRLARQGVRFTRAYAAVPLTLPSHATLLTGRYPTAHLVRNNGTYFLPPAEVTLAETLAGRGFDSAAFIASFTLLGKFGLRQGFALYEEGFRQKGVALTFHDEAPADEVSDKFLAWFDKRGPRPFFAWIHYYDPHSPYQAHAEVDARFAASERLRYEGEVAFVDLHFGRVLRRLEEKGQLERTLVVVCGDHGEAFGEHGEFGHGIFCYEESLRVPLLLRHAGLGKPGRAVDARVGLVDVMPTILDCLGIPVPASVQGRSFRGLAAGGGEEKRRDVYFESRFGLEANGWAPITGMISAGHKYVSLIEPELYDLEHDAGERDNLYWKEQPLARRIDGQLRRFLVASSSGAVAGRRRLSADDLASLKTLGYVGGGAMQSGGLIDPKRGLAVYSELERLKERARGNDLDAVRRDFARLRQSHPDVRLPAMFELEFTLQKAAGSADRALAALEAGHAAFPENESFALILAAELAGRGEAARARELAQRLLAANPRLAAALVLLGDLERDEGRSAEALEHYRRALELEPQNARLKERVAEIASNAPAAERQAALERRALSLIEGGRLEEARRLLEEIVRADPRHAGALAHLGAIASRQGDLDLAWERLQQALRLDPANAPAHCNAGVVLFRRFQAGGGRRLLPQALASFNRAVALEPRLAEAYDGRGAVHMALGENAAAAEDFARLVELRPAAVNAHFNLAFALANAGRRNQARDVLVALRDAPGVALSSGERRELEALIADMAR